MPLPLAVAVSVGTMPMPISTILLRATIRHGRPTRHGSVCGTLWLTSQCVALKLLLGGDSKGELV
eukprot:782982-Prorocentrum_lima.AAC.1